MKQIAHANSLKARYSKAACLFVVALALALASGCTPRGESKSLAEILSIAQADFTEQLKNAGAVEGQIKSIEQNLSALIADGADSATISKASTDLANVLSELTSRSGYTSRPAFTELAKQLRELQADALVGDAAANRLKLIATRIYSSVASELATTRFNVLPLSPAGA